MAVDLHISPIKPACPLPVRLRDNDISLLDRGRNLSVSHPLLEPELCVPRGEVKHKLVKVLDTRLLASAQIRGDTVRPNRNHLVQAVRVPDGSERDLRGSVELGLEAPGAEDFARFEEEP